MREDLLWAGGFTALVIGGLALVRQRRLASPPPGKYNGFATSELYLRAAPDHNAPIVAIVPPRANVGVDSTASPDWLYAYWRDRDGNVREGYSRAENLAGLGDLVPLDKVFV